MKVIVMLLSLLSCVAQAGDDLHSMLGDNIRQPIDVTEVVFLKSSEWDAALDKIYSECAYIDEDRHDFPALPYIFQCGDWEVRTDDTIAEEVTVISIDGVEYVKDSVE